MTVDQQIRFVRMLRKTYADLRAPKAVQMAGAILASLARLQKFERGKK